ncbi:MAG TPA: hypothetical protein VGZ52_02460 [Acidimicrobiales bacterium]|jgi:hypothetical protein|nr:hypothetical protein [Acidimicrobiales bacterium]
MSIHEDAEPNDDKERSSSFDSLHMMGVRVVVDPEPSAAADRLADELGGDVVRDLETARGAFAARADAGRTVPVVLDDDEFDTLIRQADELNDLSDEPRIDEGAIRELRELADALARTGRIRTRTEVEFTETLNRRLSASSGMAVHPEAIKQAAAALTAAEGDVNDIDAAITQLGDRPVPEQVELEDVGASDTTIFDDDTLEQQRRSRVFALSVTTIFAGVALVMLSIGVATAVSIGVFIVGLLAGGVMLTRSRSEHRVDEGAAQASALLAAATGNAARSTEAAARGRMAEEEWLARRAQLDANRERSVEKARSARRHWDTLAGPEADPYDLEGVLRIHDPQFAITGAATKTSPTVRTVNAVYRRALARWKVAWAAIGYDSPPAIEDFDEHVLRLGGTSARARADEVEQRLKAAEQWTQAGATIDRPLILVEPESWMPEEELASMLATLPAGADVILVTR